MTSPVIQVNLKSWKKKFPGKNTFQFQAYGLLNEIIGVDICEISGIDQTTAVKLLAEIGYSVDEWKTHKHFASWMALCPGNKISSGKILSSRTGPCANRVASLLRMAANGLWNSKSYLGAYLRWMKSRLGASKAITATAHMSTRSLARTYCIIPFILIRFQITTW